MVSDPDMATVVMSGASTPQLRIGFCPPRKTCRSPELQCPLMQLHLETGSLQMKWS